MKNESLYNKTVDILVQAYFNDTLEHSNCAACAVGNIVASNMGYKIESRNIPIYGPILRWVVNDVTLEDAPEDGWGHAVLFPSRTSYTLIAEEQVSSTGYTINQLAIIESAFENRFGLNNITTNDQMFNGLMAVIDALDKIHENNDTAQTQITKERFVKQLA